MGRMRRSIPFLAVAAFSMVMLTPICGALHHCGCRPLWSGGERYCNARSAAGPHCPWCEHRWLGGVSAGLILGGQLVVFRLARRRWDATASAAAALLALPMISVGVGAIAWLPTDYPHFLATNARERLGLPAGPIPCTGRPPHAH